MTITEFLLARIAEDEAVARAASHQKVAGPFHGQWRHDSALLLSGSLLEPVDRKHIARWDPARVLAECEAKRRIVERHRKCGTGTGYCDDGGHGWDDDDPGCGDLASVASIYTDHLDYRQEWEL